MEIFHKDYLNGFIHNDIKPGNMMVDWDGNIYLIDYGIAVFVNDLWFGFRGTPNFISPEKFIIRNLFEENDWDFNKTNSKYLYVKEKFEFWGLNMPEKLISQPAFDIWAMCISVILIEKKLIDTDPVMYKMLN